MTRKIKSARAVVVLLIWIAACTSTPTTPTLPTPPTGTPTATQTPTNTPTNTATATETPPNTPTNTPSPDLATEFTVFYALPDTGIAYQLTPRRASPGITAEELVSKPGALEGQVLGTLKVVQQLSEALPPDDYTITLSGTDSVFFNGTAKVVPLPRVIHTLPVAL